MDLQHYFSVIWRRKWIILLITAIVLTVGGIGQYRITPIYTTATTIRVAVSLGLTQNAQIYTYNSQLMNTFVVLATSRPVMKQLTERLQVQRLPVIQVDVIPNTELIRIRTSSPDPELAALAGNTLAKILIEQNNQLFAGGGLPSTEILSKQVEAARVELNKVRAQYQQLVLQTPIPPGTTPVAPTLPPAAPDELTVTNLLLQEKQRTYEALLREYEEAEYREALANSMITIVEEALIPRTPSEPRIAFNLFLVALLGLFSGVMIAFIFENMDTHLHTVRDIEAVMQVSGLAKLPRTAKKHLDIHDNRTTDYAESVRFLAARIQLGEQRSKQNVIVFVGAEPGQGTSTIVANLGFALDEQVKNVVILDCNGRNPYLHKFFSLPNEKGFTDVVSGELDIKDAIQKTGYGNLRLLPFGSKHSGPIQPLDPNGIGNLVRNLRQKFDFVLIDAPALTMADVVSIAPYSDELILVARCSRVRRRAVQSSGEFLIKFKGKNIGLIVNGA